MEADLVYDVGAHTGEDTARYLKQGYRVVAVEANPALAEHLRKRFAVDIEQGNLVLVAAGVQAHEGEATFYISDRSVFSSFEKARAIQYGATATPATVPLVRFEDLLAIHGVPYYLKIDIEGLDYLCVEALTKEDLPVYLSCEIDRRYPWLVRRLSALGFNGFKLIRQRDHRVVSLPTLVDEWLGRLDAVEADHSSGPFGDDTPGPWLAPGPALAQAFAFTLCRRFSGTIRWHDLHARRT